MTLFAQGWQQQFGPGYPHSLHPAENGRTWLFYTHDFELIGKKLDAGGATIETVALGPAGADVWPLAGGGFVSARLQSGDWYGPSSLVLEQRDAGGQPQWQQTFSDTVLLSGIALTPANGGGYWLASLPQAVASTQPLWSVTKELRLRRLDAAGGVLSEVHFPDDLPFLFLVSIRQLVVLPDNGLVVMLNVSINGSDRSYRLWHFGPAGNFIGNVIVDQESNYTSGCSINLDEESNLLLATDWATPANVHHAVWRTVPLTGGEIFHQSIDARPVAGGQYHQPAPLTMIRLGCGDYLTLLHLTNFTLEAWSPDGERRWQRPVPGPMDAGYFTPAFPPARFGRYLIPAADGGALATVPDGENLKVLKIACNGLTAPGGTLAHGRVAHDNDYDCAADPEEAGPGVSLPVSLERDGEGPAIVWTDADGRFIVPLDPGAWLAQPWAANGLDPWPEVSPICDVAQALLVFPGSAAVDVSIPLAATSGVGTEPGRNPRWQLYPNPATDRFVIQSIQPEADGEVRITVRSVQGQAVYHQRSSSDRAIEIPVTDWSPGLYHVEIYEKSRIETFRLVKM